MKIIIVGTGLSAATFYHLLKINGYNNIEIFETRNHIGGNCYDYKEGNITVHKYGPHTFHTNDVGIWNFVNQFDSFNDFKLIVKARINSGQIIDVPFNLNSVDMVGDWNEEKILRELFITYSEKHWGCSFDQLPPSIINRVPTKRNNRIEYYHTDKFEGVPSQGYTQLITNMFDGAKINIGCDKNEWRKYNVDLIYYTGSIDEYYDYIYGILKYRSLDIDFVRVKRTPYIQLNECNNWYTNTRQVDHSYWYNKKFKDTIVSIEYPTEFSIYNNKTERFYPKYFQSQEPYNKYKNIPNSKTVFGGRLGTYKYLDMDDCIKQAIILFNNKVLNK